MASASLSNCEYFFSAGANDRKANAMGYYCVIRSRLCVTELLLHCMEKHRELEKVLWLDRSEQGVNWMLEIPLLSGKFLAVKSSNTRVCSCVVTGRVEQVCSTDQAEIYSSN